MKTDFRIPIIFSALGFFLSIISPLRCLAQSAGASQDSPAQNLTLPLAIIAIIIITGTVLFFMTRPQSKVNTAKEKKEEKADIAAKTEKADAPASKGSYIQWNDTLSVNITEIDGQHQKLVSMMNELYDAMQIGKGKQVLEPILNKMIEYVGVHFSTEEQYLTRFSYPDLEKHEAEHRSFTQKALEFQRDFQAGKLGLTLEVMAFLKDWLINHIMGTDKRYSPFLNQHGIK